MTHPIKKRIGIVGGGQLGKMLIESAMPWNVNFNILEASADCPAGRYATHFIEGSLMDSDKIKELARISDVITYEIEHINVETLIELEQSGIEVIPSAKILSIIQNKGRQKSFYQDHNLATSAFTICLGKDAKVVDLEMFKYDKIVVKSCTGGYDGKGVMILDRNDVQNGKVEDVFDGEVILEEFVPDAIELSVIVARNNAGDIRSFPTVEMVFDPKINLVDYLFAPSNVPNSIQKEAENLALKAIEALEGVGLFAVELFVDQNGKCLINEIAPRPHNSGHHTIEACYTSQYEQLLRILLDLPLGETDLLKPAVMTNILGADGFSGDYNLEGMEALAQTPGAYLHWYNKSTSKPGRKMGHFTVMDDSLEKAVEKSKSLRTKIKTVKAS